MQTRTLRRELAHQGKNLAADKRLINGLKLAEKARANVIVGNGLQNTGYRYNYKDDEKGLKVSI